MRKKILIVTAIIICCAAAWGLYLYKKPRTSARNMPSMVTLTATELYSQYQQNEVAADKQYADKVLTVKGIVDDIQQTDSSASISLHGADAGGVNCSFATVEKHATMPVKGTAITIKGRCTGFLMDVNLVDCVME